MSLAHGDKQLAEGKHRPCEDPGPHRGGRGKLPISMDSQSHRLQIPAASEGVRVCLISGIEVLQREMDRFPSTPGSRHPQHQC